MPSLVINATGRLTSSVFSGISTVFLYSGVFTWDFILAVLNLFTFNKKKGKVVPKGCPGEGGVWPAFVPPKKGDSRSACPALNVMANHGILPHDGRNITFRNLSTLVRQTYNFGPSFCFFVPWFSAQLLGRDYWSDTFDLSDLSVHNGIEHDASLVREDTNFQPDQGIPATDLIHELLSHATGKPNKDFPDSPILTAADLSLFSGKRRAEARKRNGQFTLSTFHKMFGSANASTMLIIMGGIVPDLRTWLLEERFPDNWEPRFRQRFGLTMAQFNSTVLRVEAGIHEKHEVGHVMRESGSADSGVFLSEGNGSNGN
ncbi:hypothetical protein JAAARDRAFT_36206 [Jaapia argillacea MUCL 33604]|uniref:Heme haloperoxidase family profile domain-containing protein n=1 Tax=Jaapia argillacea MUCL 33604 TaxID=933084 RepID=A0A067Q289_9AGAM|nr:hypothetical protein JAAARDRAFT_36206 [Jaapia argillacea MUCL 33604]